ncbi:MAG: SDR family NAD(P)-dependent oxidoreductase [Hyphomicrobiaceae bacterium]|nr:SDR family NAD(P)-dependent oxidoreductase [Hyphomicrobiaceae bacterium]
MTADGSNGGRKRSSAASRRPVLVTGGAGFIGCNLADRLAREGHDVIVLDALMRPGAEANLAWLKRRHPERISAAVADVRDEAAVTSAAREASAVFHLAAQVAVTTSLDDPCRDFDINVRGTLLLLEALRRRRDRIPFVFASTNKVYGDLGGLALERAADAYLPRDTRVRAHGVGEDQPLSLHTPYGCSKGAADQYVLDYARSFGMPTVVMRMSCIYGPRQLGTEDQGWVAHFVSSALAREPITIYGDGCQVRDVLHVADAVEAYLAAWRRITTARGNVFNLGGGPANAVSLLQVVSEVGMLVGRPLAVELADWRASDQRYYVSDIRRAERMLALPPPRGWRDGLRDLYRWMQKESAQPAAVPTTAAAATAQAAELP